VVHVSVRKAQQDDSSVRVCAMVGSLSKILANGRVRGDLAYNVHTFNALTRTERTRGEDSQLLNKRWLDFNVVHRVRRPHVPVESRSTKSPASIGIH